VSETPRAADGDGPERDKTRVYAGVIALEVVVIVAIWLFQRYFGS
jgi:hypothetical protein